MKNMIALLIGMTLLTACGKQVGKDANNPLPPIGTPGEYIPTNPPIEKDEILTLSDPNNCYTANDNVTILCTDATVGTVTYQGGIEIKNILHTNSTPVYIRKNGINQCTLIFDENYQKYLQVVSNGSGGFMVKKCSFNVSIGDVISVHFLNSAEIGGIELEVTEYIEN